VPALKNVRSVDSAIPESSFLSRPEPHEGASSDQTPNNR